MPPPAPLLLAGPTAVGKSAVALLLAERRGGEIVSVDSMQVYVGLDLGTAKPSLKERQRVPHHVIDVVALTERFDAAQFAERARLAVAEIRARGRVPILCGGTGLYFKALRSGLGETPPADPDLRARLEATPLDVLLRELKEHDPATLALIDRSNPRRVVRAVEVIRLTGRPFSALRADWRDSAVGEGARPREDQGDAWGPVCCLTRDSWDLRQRIDARVDEMFRRGLVEETRALLAKGLAQNRTALQAIGYRQVAEYLRGERSLEETIALVKRRTAQFAKRQMAWFRRQLPVRWFPCAPCETAESVADRLDRDWSVGFTPLEQTPVPAIPKAPAALDPAKPESD